MPRRCHDCTYSETYKDLRSEKRGRNRLSKQSAKYYGYRGVQPSWIDQEYLSFTNTPRQHFYPNFSIFVSSAPLVTEPTHAKVAMWTKRDMWLDRGVDIWPLDIRHHRGRRIREKYSFKWNELEFGRRMKQKSRCLEFAAQDGELLATDDDADTMYWDFEENWDFDLDEGRNDHDERPPRYVGLDGECYPEDSPDLVEPDDPIGPWERELIELYCDTGDGDDFSVISEREVFDSLPLSSIEDDYEVVSWWDADCVAT
ncbi:hypothetical protein AYL99_06525 [Fonsecaea erecta]|uniref:Uncharacterized protein n=1 Tax=Fonsecaea erecta TaxID=1367422 RepID=A0A178ZHE5_9EURO|nr:hypothetical protein AYL99_06525 [Fonsecaea erecta]OAP59227.1 hypothetical protein AYL99_06525 [Fonsecaea erecta]